MTANVKRIFILLVCSVFAVVSHAQDGYPVCPLYFGPNALPVPDMLNGTVSESIYAELDFDLHKGFYGDFTETIFAQLNIPLFTPRVNLSLWFPVVEFYQNTPESTAHQKPLSCRMKGHEFGNVYISTDIHLLRQSGWRPDIAIRAALITASGDSEDHARFFDAPGYFFDGSAAKSIFFRENFFKEVRFVANAGFLCWQVGKSVQNDAWMYGLGIEADTAIALISASWQGYNGWIGNGDRPMVIKARISFKAKSLRPVLAYEYGLRDYPFHHFRCGIGYEF